MAGRYGGKSPPRETTYRPALRSDLGRTVLLTGTVDPALLNVLNNNFFGQEEVPNFDFEEIRALTQDAAAARKGAIGREARYGGLLDKLAIQPASGPLPSPEELKGVSSWIAQVPSNDAPKLLPQIAELAKGSAELTNLVVMVVGAAMAPKGWDAVVDASEDGDAFRCTLLAAGELRDGGEGGGFRRVTRLEEGDAAPPSSPGLPRKGAYRLLAHALALESTAGQALTAYEYPPSDVEAIASPYSKGDFVARDEDGKEVEDEFLDVKMESRMIRAMRETGFTQLMELDVLVDKGLQAYKEYVANPPKGKASAPRGRTARDEEDEKIMAILEEQSAKSEARKEAEAKKEKDIEVEGIAKEWAVKEYSLRMLGGDLDESVMEEDFVESTRGEALAEGEKTYERIRSREYIREQELLEKSRVNVENKLFWEGMPPLLRKKREKMVEKVKLQYMDLLSEEDLESIILNE